MLLTIIIIFLILKLAGLLSISWFLVFLPLLIQLAFLFIPIVVFVFGAIIACILGDK